jgi:toxin ParE1/3/4
MGPPFPPSSQNLRPKTERRAMTAGSVQILASMAEPRQSVPHDEAMARMDALIESAKNYLRMVKKAERSPQATRIIRQPIESAVLPADEHLTCTGLAGCQTRGKSCPPPNYTMVYTVMNTAIEVLNVVHARTEYP